MSNAKESRSSSDRPKRDRWMFSHAGSQSHILEFLSLKPVESLVSSTNNAELICSYNWTNHPTPSILAPGGAPIWKGRELPMRIRPDLGVHFVDQNSSKVPRYPFEVVFRALECMGSRYCFDDVDVLVNRNSLRKLFDFCAGRVQDSFRIDLFTVHRTLILERCERSATEMLHGSIRSGYGHNFEQAFTQPALGLEDSTSHHRVLRYDMGGLNFVVRFEVDASYSDLEDSGVQLEPSEISKTSDAADDGAQLAAKLGTLALSPQHVDKEKHAQSVFASLGGQGSAQSTIAELKTGKKSIASIMPQLWFGRTPYLIKGVHDHGLFRRLVITRAGDSFQSWETKLENQMALRKMVGLIGRARDIIMDADGHAAIMIFQKDQPGKLRILRRTTAKMPLPDGDIRAFWSGNAEHPQGPGGKKVVADPKIVA